MDILTAEIIQKYKKSKTATLKKKAQDSFNAWIRKRDAGKQCISCPSYKIDHASHYFSAGNYNFLRFHEDNVHGSCVKCNTFLHGNLIEYRKGLIKRIGIERVENLEQLASMNRVFKNDRFLFIEIIEKYSAKNQHFIK